MTEESAPDQGFDQLVVIGASAGGVEALSVLVANLPPDLAAPIVVAQHLSPSHPSQLGAILAQRSVLPLITVADCEPLYPGTIYLVPANRHVEITDHHVRVFTDTPRRPTPSIDRLMITAAEVFGDRLIAVIMTGSGSDGAAGAHAVKEAGGTVIIQDPVTAAFPSMPRALAPPLVDMAIPLEGLGRLLGNLVATPPGFSDTLSNSDFTALLERLHDRRGIDFTAYKPATIGRRLHRRMTVLELDSLAAYLTYLEENPAEEAQLVADFLIKVTRFFRDPAVFNRLREEILPALIAHARETAGELRIWSAGCATGEEAYSLSMLVADLLGEPATAPLVRIFATDLDETALAFARRGVYSAAALANVPPDVVARHFTTNDGAYEVRKSVRKLIVFGGHDLAQRPPFPRIDLVLCRNVLIYFTPELQRRALEIFAYSLRDGGYLVLGKSETPRPFEHAFTDVDRRLRFYRREGPRSVLPPVSSSAVTGRMSPLGRSTTLWESSLQHPTEKSRDLELAGSRSEDLMRRLPIGVVVVNRTYDIEMINGRARELLSIHGLAIGQDLVHLAQRVSSTPLRTAIDAVARGDEVQRLPDVVTVETAAGETRYLAVSCHSDRRDYSGLVDTILVLIEDITTTILTERARNDAIARSDRLAETNRQMTMANRELTDAIDQLRTQTDDLRLATAAAQVSAEEIETLNEELQSTNEELETLHEEAQATVEELSVANEELQARTVETEELAAAHATEKARLEAVLASMSDLVMVVDRAGRAVRTNPAYDAMVETLGVSFVPADDLGVPLSDDATPRIRASRGETFRLEFTVDDADGDRRWFEATGRPLKDDEMGIGVVVIRDITDRSLRLLQKEFLTWAGHELRTPLTALQGYIQLAARRIGPDGDPRLHHTLDRAVVQVQRQVTLVGELLDVTRLESGHLALRIQALDLAALAAQAVETGQVLAQGQTIVLDAAPGPLMIEGDPGRLEQVVVNLLTNAIAYAPGTDQITVSLRRSETHALLAVTDMGPGIDPESVKTIFDRFVQAGPSERHGTGGLGLGLYISQAIVQGHGGTIEVESTLGTGATFTVCLPLSPSDAASDHLPAPSIIIPEQAS